MRKQLMMVSLVAVSVVALGGFSVSAKDRPLFFRANLAGTQEVPVVSTLAHGTLEAQFNDDGALTYKLTFEGLEGGNTLFSHIHLGQKSVNGGVMVFLCGGGNKPACPNVSGTVEGTIVATDVIGPTGAQQMTAGAFDEFTRALLNGTAYANLHTVTSPGGEIRGQIRVDRNNGQGNNNR